MVGWVLNEEELEIDKTRTRENIILITLKNYIVKKVTYQKDFYRIIVEE